MNLLLPAAFLPLLAFIFFDPRPSQPTRYWSEFIITAIFLNVAHVTFTVVNLVQIPEMREYARSKSSFGLYAQFAKWALIFVGLYLFGKVCVEQLLYLPGIGAALFTPSVLHGINDLFSTPHTIAQTKGLSLLYNQQIKKNCDLTSDELILFARTEWREKFLFSVLIGLSALSVVIYFFTDVRGLGTVFLVANSTCALLLLFNSYSLPKSWGSNKHSFLLRVLYWPFAMTNLFWGMAIVRSIHGVEYLLVTYNVIGNSKTKRKKLAWGLVLMAGIAVVSLHRLLLLQFDDKRVMVFLMGLTFALNVFHYYLDGIIFRYRDKSVRDFVGPLLQPYEGGESTDDAQLSVKSVGLRISAEREVSAYKSQRA